jgi:hypothetical protein
LEPVLITTADHADDEIETIHVFSIDGVEYHMPAHPPANIGLRFTDIIGTEGGPAAQAWLFREMLGDDGYEALLECEDITDEQIEKIGEMVGDVALAAAKDKQGNRAARRSSQRNGGRGSRATSTTSTPTSVPSSTSRSRKRSTS